MKEDEYLRDGVTEDIITELSKIKGLKIFSRPTVLPYRDKSVTAAQVGQQLKAAFVLTGSIRRAGNRLRINVAARGRADRLARLVRALRPRDGGRLRGAGRDRAQDRRRRCGSRSRRRSRQALAAKPTDNLQAYDLYLRGKSYARRLTRQDLEFALQMFENAVALDPRFALAHAAIANVCAQYHQHFERTPAWIERAKAASQRASALGSDAPEIQVAEAWILYAEAKYDEAIRRVRQAIERKPDAEGAYYLLGRALFAAGKYQEVADMAEAAIAAAGEDYNIYVPINNALGALGKKDALRNSVLQRIQVLEAHLKKVPEDARGRTLLATDYAQIGPGGGRDPRGQPRDGPAAERRDGAVQRGLRLRPARQEARGASRRCARPGTPASRTPSWARRDPDLAILHGDPEFEKLYPPAAAE